MAPTVINQHQRCGLSDSPFAMMYCCTTDSKNELDGWTVLCGHVRYRQKGILLSRRKMNHTRDKGSESCSGSAGNGDQFRVLQEKSHKRLQ